MKTCKNKNCTQVNPQSLDSFSLKARNPDGLQRECKTCVSIYKQAYRTKMGETLCEQKRISYEKHKHKRKLTERERATARKYKLENKDKIKEQRKIYVENNIEHIRAQKRKYDKDRRNRDINFKLAATLRNRVGKALKRNSKTGSAVADLGCSIQEFKFYIEAKFLPGMTWDNHGEWHLDHILPLASFDLTNREEFLKACHYSNYQPLWSLDNIIKGAKVTYEI